MKYEQVGKLFRVLMAPVRAYASAMRTMRCWPWSSHKNFALAIAERPILIDDVRLRLGHRA